MNHQKGAVENRVDDRKILREGEEQRGASGPPIARNRLNFRGHSPNNSGSHFQPPPWRHENYRHEGHTASFVPYGAPVAPVPMQAQSWALYNCNSHPDVHYTSHYPYGDQRLAGPYPRYDSGSFIAPNSATNNRYQGNDHQALEQGRKPISSCARMKFPEKLMYALVHFPNDEALTWDPSGSCFIVLNSDLFVKEVLSKVSKTVIKYPSFVRKLHRWGFSRLPSRSNTGCFAHPCFNIFFPEKASLITAATGKLSAREISNGSSESRAPNHSHSLHSSRRLNPSDCRQWIEASQLQPVLSQSSHQHLEPEIFQALMPSSAATNDCETAQPIRFQGHLAEQQGNIEAKCCTAVEASDDANVLFSAASDTCLSSSKGAAGLATPPLQNRSVHTPIEDIRGEQSPVIRFTFG